MPNFQSFDRHSTPTPGKPFVTIQRDGKLITFNRASYKLMGEPEAVDLRYDPDERIVGICPFDPNNPNAYVVRQMASSAGTYTVSGRAFTLHWGIDTSVALRYQASFDNGYLIVDLKQRGVDVTGFRSRFKGAAGLRSRYKSPSAQSREA